jgi:hypothetical protein
MGIIAIKSILSNPKTAGLSAMAAATNVFFIPIYASLHAHAQYALFTSKLKSAFNDCVIRVPHSAK